MDEITKEAILEIGRLMVRIDTKLDRLIDKFDDHTMQHVFAARDGGNHVHD